VKANAAAALLCACVLTGASRAEENGASATGSIAWIDSDRLDLVGSVSAELPLAQAGAWRVFAGFSAVTAIAKSTENFTFLVDEVTYGAVVGARRPIEGRGAIEVFAAEQGAQLVDDAGRARVRVLGAAWESGGFRGAFGPFGWSERIAAAGVVEHHGLDAFATAAGEVRYLGAIAKNRRVGLGAVAAVDALFGDDGGADFTIGPRLEFDLTGDRRMGLFVKWLHGGNPLGLSTDGVLAGFDFAQGLHADGTRVTPPEISGLAAAGGGSNGRGVARLDIHVATPPFLGGTVAEVEVDANVLTASDLNDLFYLYDVGVAHPFSAWRAGGWFHHRSNHVLDGVNPEVTSINVLEAGVESSGWNRAEPSQPLGRFGALDAQLRAGWLIDSAFGEDAAWHARGGARWASPELGPTRIYLSAQLERGDVSASSYAAGVLLPRGWDVKVEFRHDEQLYSVDQRAELAVATLRY